MDPQPGQRKAAPKQGCWCDKCGGPTSNGNEIPYSTYRRHQRMQATLQRDRDAFSTTLANRLTDDTHYSDILQNPLTDHNVAGPSGPELRESADRTRDLRRTGLGLDETDEEMDVDEDEQPQVLAVN